MTTLADIVTVTTRPDSGESILTVRDNGYKILGGAALYDLLDRGRLGRTGEGRASRVVVLDPSPVPEPSLEYGFATARKRAEQWPRNAVLRLGGGIHLRDGIYGGLVQEGVLGPNQKAGFFSEHRYPVLDLAAREALIDAVRAVLLEDREPDEWERRIAALIAVGDGDTGGLLDIVLDQQATVTGLPHAERQSAKEWAKRRGMELAKSDWVALTTLHAIQLPQQIAGTSAMFGIAHALIPR